MPILSIGGADLTPSGLPRGDRCGLLRLAAGPGLDLVDYYIVRRGHYAIAEIFNPRGFYGRWGWRGTVAYLIGFGAMVPFFSTGLYTGPVANSLGGADISRFVGLPAAGILYWVFGRSIDVSAERAVAGQELGELDAAGAARGA